MSDKHVMINHVQSVLPALRDMTIERAYYFYVTLNLLIISEMRSHQNL